MPHLLPKKQNKIQPANKKASANFSGAKIRSAHFSAGGIFVSGLAGQRPRVQRFPAACTFPSGASRPIPPATILFIPALQSSISQLPSSRLGRPMPYIPSHYFFNIYKAPSSRRISAISTLPLRPSTHLPFSLPFSIFYIGVSILPAFAFPYLHPTTLPTSSISSVLLPLLQPAGQTRNIVSRAGAACKAADGAGEEPAFLFFLFFIFFCFSLFSLLSNLPGAAASPRRLHFSFYFFFLFFLFIFVFFFLFAFVLLFVFSFCFFAFIFAFFFLLFSIYFSSDFLFLFFLCPFFFLLFLSFYFCSYLCFFCILFLLLLLSLPS